MKTLDEIKRLLPRDELRDDAIGIFESADEMNAPPSLTDPDVAIAAFRAAFFDIPEIQTIELKL